MNAISLVIPTILAQGSRLKFQLASRAVLPFAHHFLWVFHRIVVRIGSIQLCMHGQAALTAAAAFWSPMRSWFLERGASNCTAAFIVATFRSVVIFDTECDIRVDRHYIDDSSISRFQGLGNTTASPVEKCSSSDRVERSQGEEVTEQVFYGIPRDVRFRRMVSSCSREDFRSPNRSTRGMSCISCGNAMSNKHRWRG